MYAEKIEKELSPYEEINLFSLCVEGGRKMTFSVVGTQKGTPVLFFYSQGCNRRIAVWLHTICTENSLKVICVNRPGVGGTSTAKGRGPAAQAATYCDDIVDVLNALDISRIGLFFQCAGAPFAFRFACQNRDRTTLKLVGIGSWVLPADCAETTTFHKFGALYCPFCIVMPFIKIMEKMFYKLVSMPVSDLLPKLEVILSDQERDNFVLSMNTDEELQEQINWILEEKGGMIADVSVLLSKASEVGINYEQIGGRVILFHGENDETVPIAAAEWLKHQMKTSEVILNRLPDGSHEGSLLMLYPSLKKSLAFFNDLDDNNNS